VKAAVGDSRGGGASTGIASATIGNASNALPVQLWADDGHLCSSLTMRRDTLRSTLR